MEPVSWREPKWNPYVNAIELEMLTDEGVVKSVFCKLKTEGAFDLKEHRLIKFDRSFVIHKLANLIRPLARLKREKVTELINEALNLLYENHE